MRFRYPFMAVIAILSILFLSACERQTATASTADQRAAEQTKQASSEADRKVGGPPHIIHYTEKRNLKLLYELRDQASLLTYTYVRDMQGQLHHLCDSIGFGIPASVQFTNPDRIAHKTTYQGGSYGTLPQPEPNALFMPEGLSATYIMCIDPAGGDPKPLYEEDEITVSLFPLRAVDSYQIEVNPISGD